MKDNRKDLKIDWNEFLRWFDATMKRYGSIIPAPKFLTTGKKAQVQRLVNQFGSKEILVQAVVNMARSDVRRSRPRRRAEEDMGPDKPAAAQT